MTKQDLIREALDNALANDYPFVLSARPVLVATDIILCTDLGDGLLLEDIMRVVKDWQESKCQG